MWGSRIQPAWRLAGFCNPLVPSSHLLDFAGCLVVGFDSVGQFRLLKGVSYGALRGQSHLFCQRRCRQPSQRRRWSSWLLTLLVIKLCSSMLSLKLTVGGAQAAAAPSPPPSFFPGHAGVQLMRQLRTSSASVGGLRATPCGVFFHW